MGLHQGCTENSVHIWHFYWSKIQSQYYLREGEHYRDSLNFGSFSRNVILHQLMQNSFVIICVYPSIMWDHMGIYHTLVIKKMLWPHLFRQSFARVIFWLAVLLFLPTLCCVGSSPDHKEKVSVADFPRRTQNLIVCLCSFFSSMAIIRGAITMF